MVEQTTEQYLAERFPILINLAYERKELTETMKNALLSLPFDTLDELDQCYKDLIDALENKEMYMTLDSIERGELLLEKTTDPTKREKFKQRLKDLTEQLERMNPPS